MTLDTVAEWHLAYSFRSLNWAGVTRNVTTTDLFSFFMPSVAAISRNAGNYTILFLYTSSHNGAFINDLGLFCVWV